MKNVTMIVVLLLAGSASAQEISLYPTGPGEDASFVRFVDGTASALEVVSAAGKIALTPQKPASAYQAVKAKWPVKGSVVQAGKKTPVSLQVKPGEFASAIALTGPKGLFVQVLRETPNDFNGLKASIGFASVAGVTCADPGLKVDGRDVHLFEHTKQATVQRRLVNPLALGVQLTCAGKPVGKAVALGKLEAGERYSVYAVPSAGSARLLFVHDQVAQ